MLVGAAMSVLLVPAPALGAGLLVSPTRIDAQVEQGDPLPPISVTNGTDRALVVDVVAAPARQDLAGLPLFDLSPRSLRAGRRLLRVSPDRLRLAPGEQGRVGLIVGPPPRPGQIGAYAVVAFTAREASERAERGAVVAPAVRLTSNLLLRYPGRARITGTVTALRAAQGPGRTLRFFARVRNQGNLHALPRARLEVSAGGGRVLRRRFRAERVLPGAERELALDVTDTLPAGEYKARVEARVGRRRSVADTAFRLVGPNRLPTPELRIVSLPAPQPDAGEDFDVEATVENVGTGPLTPTGTLTVAKTAGGRPLAREPVRLAALDPGARDDFRVELPGIREGSYALTLAFTDARRPLAERTLVFEAGTRPPLLTRVQDWLAGHVPLVLAAFALLLITLMAGFTAYIRKLRRQAAHQAGTEPRAGEGVTEIGSPTEPEPAPPHTAAPAPLPAAAPDTGEETELVHQRADAPAATRAPVAVAPSRPQDSEPPHAGGAPGNGRPAGPGRTDAATADRGRNRELMLLGLLAGGALASLRKLRRR